MIQMLSETMKSLNAYGWMGVVIMAFQFGIQVGIRIHRKMVEWQLTSRLNDAPPRMLESETRCNRRVH